MFSLSVATSCVTASPTVSPAGQDSASSSAVVARAGVAERVVRGDPVGELLGERPEILRAGDEVGLAVDLDEHRALDRDVRDDEPLGRGAPGLGGRGGEALLAKDLARLVEIALRFHERLLAIHHAGAGFVAQIRDELGVDFHDSL